MGTYPHLGGIQDWALCLISPLPYYLLLKKKIPEGIFVVYLIMVQGLGGFEKLG